MLFLENPHEQLQVFISLLSELASSGARRDSKYRPQVHVIAKNDRDTNCRASRALTVTWCSQAALLHRSKHRTRTLSVSCGVEGPPCQAPAEIVPAPTYRPTYKPSLRGGDDDDCVDDEDWSYTTKEGDVFTCERVAEKLKRCTIRFSADGVRADEACKKTCGTCP